ncbi:MAG: hypothetical protein ACE5FH_09170 [Candidatus Zixiibacteriota bacterium]
MVQRKTNFVKNTMDDRLYFELNPIHKTVDRFACLTLIQLRHPAAGRKLMETEKEDNAMLRLLFACTLTVIAMIGCSGKKNDDSKSTNRTQAQATPQANKSKTGPTKTIEYQMSDYPHDFTGKPQTIAAMTFTPEIQWNDLGPVGDAIAAYTFGPLTGDRDSATVFVYSLGKTGFEGIEEQMEQYIYQMEIPDGRDPHLAAIRYNKLVDSMTMHITEVVGNYVVSTDQSGNKLVKPNYRMVIAAFQAPGGNVVFKLTGPDFTARIMIEGLMPMLWQAKKVR